jgi:hypothetical protein
MKPEEIRNEYTRTYDKGILNHGVRAWFYLQKGLDLVNQFKYLVAGILAIYYTLKLDSYLVLLSIFIISIPILTFAGWFYTHKMSKAMEWTSMVSSSYFARYNVDLAEKNTESTVEIEKEIKEIKNLINQYLNHK